MPDIRILISVPQPLRSQILSPAAERKFHALGTVVQNEDGRNWTAGELAAHLPGVDALVTSWGFVPLDSGVLASADRLRIVAHAAGSVKRHRGLMPPRGSPTRWPNTRCFLRLWACVSRRSWIAR